MAHTGAQPQRFASSRRGELMSKLAVTFARALRGTFRKRRVRDPIALRRWSKFSISPLVYGSVDSSLNGSPLGSQVLAKYF